MKKNVKKYVREYFKYFTKDERLRPFYKAFKKSTKGLSTSKYIQVYKRFVAAVFDFDKITEWKKVARVEISKYLKGRELKHYLKRLDKVLTEYQFKNLIGEIKRISPLFL